MSEPKETMCSKPGEFSWNELVTSNAKASGDFYSKLFGWQPTPFKAAPDAPPYTLFKMDGNEMGVGGMIQPPQPGVPTMWVPYVVVADIDASLAKAGKLGAKTIVPIMAVGEVGRIAVIQDPQGAALGLHEFPKAK